MRRGLGAAGEVGEPEGVSMATMTDDARRFYRHLHDTLVLLGCARFAATAANPDIITEADVKELQRLNWRLIDECKYKLIGINSTTVRVVDESP